MKQYAFAAMLELTTPVQYVKGIGPRRAEILATRGISTLEDLLYYLPFRYEDRQNPRRIAEVRPGEMASLIGEVRGSALFRTRRMPLFQLTVGDPGGGRATLRCLWFNGTYLKDRFKPGQLVALYGRVEQDQYGRSRNLQIMQPQFEILGPTGEEDVDALPESLEIGRIVPVYEAMEHNAITSRVFRRVIRRALEDLPRDLPDAMPPAIRERLQLPSRYDAFWNTHWPPESVSLADLQAARTPAQVRLIFEELFYLELGLELKRRRMRAQPGITFNLDDRVREAIKRILPFHPTTAQKKVLKEIADDMRRPSPMRRLLQGDVGSGKTIVALEAAIIAIEDGYQVALMAPTEILATQHYLSARRILEHAGYRIVLLTGSLEPAQKRDVRRHIAHGNAQLVIGTHALIEEKVEFARLGLAIVDEQHRFGVMQRLKLMKKSPVASHQSPVLVGVNATAAAEPLAAEIGATDDRRPATGEQAEPDTLVMTATPIPRTLALTLYGDLDLSVIDELPPGRTPIVTRRVSDERASEVFEFVRKQVKEGHQAYIVYPVIEEGFVPASSENPDVAPGSSRRSRERPARAKQAPLLPNMQAPGELKAAVKMYDELRQRILPDLRIALLHGRLDAEQKDEVMRRFQAGQVDVLVSTTVIEVGVDVPNANLMVIEHAERFGLSQLHQLRGRIGRGAAKSFCVLMTSGRVTPEAEQRLDAMVRTTNGFEIADLDLQLRGPGEFFGTRQAGLPAFRVANLIRDRQLLEVAKREARDLLGDAEVPPPDLSRALQHLRSHWQRRYGLVEVG
ncbi:MAG TPA: ATP-dependent DNA helicase RecG [Terriglobales bacterium]|nr:ATP-dependent DNA helicase RecG [Terriglobales bacterium]